MNIKTTIPLLALVLVLSASAFAQELAKAGDNVPEFEFTKIVMNSQGRFTRDDFAGRPTLIELWGFK